MIDYKGMGARIRTLRRQANLTLAQFATQVGISPSFMGHIERGTRTPSLETLVLISKVLRVSLDGVVMGMESGETITNTDTKQKISRTL